MRRSGVGAAGAGALGVLGGVRLVGVNAAAAQEEDWRHGLSLFGEDAGAGVLGAMILAAAALWSRLPNLFSSSLTKGGQRGVIENPVQPAYDLYAPFVAGPDLVDVAPSGDRLFVAFRGPVPLSGDPHNAIGSTPGVGIIQLTDGGKAGALVSILRVANPDQQPKQQPDPHGLRVRRTH